MAVIRIVCTSISIGEDVSKQITHLQPDWRRCLPAPYSLHPLLRTAVNELSLLVEYKIKGAWRYFRSRWEKRLRSWQRWSAIDCQVIRDGPQTAESASRARLTLTMTIRYSKNHEENKKGQRERRSESWNKLAPSRRMLVVFVRRRENSLTGCTYRLEVLIVGPSE